MLIWRTQFSKVNASNQRGENNLTLKNIQRPSFPHEVQQAKARLQDWDQSRVGKRGAALVVPSEGLLSATQPRSGFVPSFLSAFSRCRLLSQAYFCQPGKCWDANWVPTGEELLFCSFCRTFKSSFDSSEEMKCRLFPWKTGSTALETALHS